MQISSKSYTFALKTDMEIKSPTNKPLLVSHCTAKSLWQKYFIFNNRLEFHTLLGVEVIPFSQIEKVSISESEFKDLLKGDLHLKDFKPALKLDWANFLEHIVIDKNTGRIKRVLFTPEDVHLFKQTLDEALNKYRKLDQN